MIPPPVMPRDANEIDYGELERLSALETLKGLRNPEAVTLGDLVQFLAERGLWPQFAKITLGDLRDSFAPAPAATDAVPKRPKKRRILEDELEDAYSEKAAAAAKEKDKDPEDGGMSTDELARQVLPFIEGNGEVTLEDIAEYSRIDKKVLRHHLAVLVKDGRLERVGVGRHAIYSSL
jgi:DNA-binding transcriptional ArsR family regulator